MKIAFEIPRSNKSQRITHLFSPSYRLAWLSLSLIAVGCVALVAADHRGSEHVVLGYLFGTVFAHTTLAAAWTAFGPLPLSLRYPLSVVWLGLMVFCFTMNIGIHGGADASVAVIIGICVFAQYFVLQLPFWILVFMYGSRLRNRSDVHRAGDPRERQFGIGQLMIITAIVGLVFGIGRMAVVTLAPQIHSGMGRETPIFIFLAVAAIFFTLPLVLAALMQRFAVPAVMLTLLLISLATAWELPLLSVFNQAPGPDALHLVWINLFTSAWILLFALVARLNGYRLAATIVNRVPIAD